MIRNRDLVDTGIHACDFGRNFRLKAESIFLDGDRLVQDGAGDEGQGNALTSATCFDCLRAGAWRGSVQVPGWSLSHRLPSTGRVALTWPA